MSRGSLTYAQTETGQPNVAVTSLTGLLERWRQKITYPHLLPNKYWSPHILSQCSLCRITVWLNTLEEEIWPMIIWCHLASWSEGQRLSLEGWLGHWTGYRGKHNQGAVSPLHTYRQLVDGQCLYFLHSPVTTWFLLLGLVDTAGSSCCFVVWGIHYRQTTYIWLLCVPCHSLLSDEATSALSGWVCC